MGTASQSNDVENGSVSRRAFLKKAGLAAGALMAANVAGVAHADSKLPGLGSISALSKARGEDDSAEGAGASDPVETGASASPDYYPTLVKQYFGTQGIIYEVIDDLAIRVSYTTDYMPDGIGIIVIFDEDGDPYVKFRNWELGNFPGTERRARAINVCNDLNNEYRWVKFSIDDDNDVAANIDAIIDENSCGAEVAELILRMVNICDEAYLEFAEIQ